MTAPDDTSKPNGGSDKKAAVPDGTSSSGASGTTAAGGNDAGDDDLSGMLAHMTSDDVGGTDTSKAGGDADKKTAVPDGTSASGASGTSAAGGNDAGDDDLSGMLAHMTSDDVGGTGTSKAGVDADKK